MNTSKHTWIIALFIIIIGVIIVTLALRTPAETTLENTDQESSMAESEFTEYDTRIPADVVTALDQPGMLIDIDESTIEWTAQKQIVRTWVDKGTLSFAQGMISRDDAGLIDGGAFLVDMNSIAVTETGMGPNTGDRLEGHLRSDDFFSIDTYPFASFVITDTQYDGEMVTAEGDLTIKDTTQPYTFTLDDNGDTLSGQVVINRADFDVRFGSPSFFNNLGDNAIDDEFTLDLEIKVME